MPQLENDKVSMIAAGSVYDTRLSSMSFLRPRDAQRVLFCTQDSGLRTLSASIMFLDWVFFIG